MYFHSKERRISMKVLSRESLHLILIPFEILLNFI